MVLRTKAEMNNAMTVSEYSTAIPSRSLLCRRLSILLDRYMTTSIANIHTASRTSAALP